jgi:hypothetical protein
VPVGLVTVEARATGRYSGRLEWGLSADFSGELPLSMDFQLTARGAVVDARDGKPIAGASLFVVESLAKRALESLTPTPMGQQTIRFQPKGFMSFEREVDVVDDHGTEIPEVMLERGEDLIGRVVGLRGQPVVNAVVLTRAGRELGYDEFDRSETRATTDADGRFRLDRQSRGPLKVEVFAEGFLSPDETRDWKGGAEPVTIVLHRAATIRGRALDEKGRGVADVPVSVFDGGDIEHSRSV